MKVLIFNYKYKRKNNKGHRLINFERVLFKVFLAVFVLLLGVQAALLNPAIKSVVTIRDDMKGVPLKAEEYLYAYGTVELRLMNAGSIPDLKILVNGTERESFTERSVEVYVIDGDVLEIDGSDIGGTVEIAISSVSSNIDKSYLGRVYKVNGDICRIAKFRVMPDKN